MQHSVKWTNGFLTFCNKNLEENLQVGIILFHLWIFMIYSVIWYSEMVSWLLVVVQLKLLLAWLNYIKSKHVVQWQSQLN